jgi:hypothetical protein
MNRTAESPVTYCSLNKHLFGLFLVLIVYDFDSRIQIQVVIKLCIKLLYSSYMKSGQCMSALLPQCTSSSVCNEMHPVAGE